jgi:hypothetical protein
MIHDEFICYRKQSIDRHQYQIQVWRGRAIAEAVSLTASQPLSFPIWQMWRLCTYAISNWDIRDLKLGVFQTVSQLSLPVLKILGFVACEDGYLVLRGCVVHSCLGPDPQQSKTINKDCKCKSANVYQHLVSASSCESKTLVFTQDHWLFYSVVRCTCPGFLHNLRFNWGTCCFSFNSTSALRVYSSKKLHRQ